MRCVATISWLAAALAGCTDDPPREASRHDAPSSLAALEPPIAEGPASIEGWSSGIPLRPQPSAATHRRVDRIAHLLPERSYLEERCSDVDFAGLASRRCSYRRGGAPLEVTLAAIPRETLARWILDAASHAIASARPPALDALATRLARYVVEQSSGAVPLDGDVWEDMARDGVGKTYRFDRGVSLSSGTCRPMSLTRAEWCADVADRSGAPFEACLETLMSPESWAALCSSWIREGLVSGTHPGLRVRARILSAIPRSGP